jgi:mannonate dehydratase
MNMNAQLGRREFVLTGVAASTHAYVGMANDSQPTPRRPRLDLHVHLFGTGDSGSGCRISKRIRTGLRYQYMVETLRLRHRAKTMDEGYERVLVEQVLGSPLTKVAILGQDAVCDRQGNSDWDRTHWYVPNDYVFAVAKRTPDRLIPCVSINPARRDALDELARCTSQGARLLKIHPPTQGVDLADRRHRAFFARCAESRVVLIVHTGHEHAAPVIDQELADPAKLEWALREGCTVVAAHCGSGSPADRPDMLPTFLAMLGKFDRLWGDTSVLGIVTRVRDFFRLLDAADCRDRLVHGSDFPFPPAPLAFGRRIGWDSAIKLRDEPNLLRRDLELKELLGIGYASAERAYDLSFCEI